MSGQIRSHDNGLQSLFLAGFVLGGSPCSGKSSLAERLSHAYSLSYYKVDDHQGRHLAQADPQGYPTMAAYARMSWDEIWSQPVDKQVEDLFSFYEERFTMILADLQAYVQQVPIIMEGAALLPGLIKTWGVAAHQAIFMAPTKEFQCRHYAQRPWIGSILDTCQHPQEAFENWMERDHRFGQAILRQAQSLGYRTITVDDSTGLDACYSAVTAHFLLQ